MASPSSFRRVCGAVLEGSRPLYEDDQLLETAGRGGGVIENRYAAENDLASPVCTCAASCRELAHLSLSARPHITADLVLTDARLCRKSRIAEPDAELKGVIGSHDCPGAPAEHDQSSRHHGLNPRPPIGLCETYSLVEFIV